MPDKSAKPLPSPPGAVEGLTRGNSEILWFDGQQRRVDVYYVADGRTVALGERVQNGNGIPSAYGEWNEGIVIRPTEGSPASFVAGQWLSGPEMVEETLLSRALARFLPIPDDSSQPLQIDDRAVLGLDGAMAAAADDPENWSVAVSGELTVPGLAEQVALRPAVVALAGDTLVFREPGEDADANADELVLALTLARDGQPLVAAGEASELAVTLESAVSLLLDEKMDGAWERPSPLWLQTGTGLLRVEQGGRERAPYRFFSESRNIDVRRWFPSLGAGASARLMLDRSGAKTLSVSLDEDEGRVVLKLTVRRPAIVFVLPGMAVDGAGLAVPVQPPGAATLARAVPLQLVPVHLCGDSASPWRLEVTDGMFLRWKRPDVPGEATLTHFTSHQNWVLPPEAAVNDAPGISTLRVLIPMLPDEGQQRFQLQPGDGTGNGALGMLVEPLDAFGTMAPEALSFGPLASFDAAPGQDRELWPGGQAGSVPEPAVLRPTYRILPPGVAADGALASFAATRVRRGAPSGDAELAPAPVTEEDEKSHNGWAYPPGRQAAERRLEDRGFWPGARFGWMGRQFLSPAALAQEGAVSLNPALAWAEVREEDGGYTATGWVRLSDDSLTPLPPAAADSREAAVNALAVAEIVLQPRSLADDASQQRWGLAQLRVVERIANGASTFTLLAGTEPSPVEIALGEQHGVNRIVVADAQSRPVAVDIAPKVKTANLNRVYLELERRGGRLVVIRGMLGWSASAAFGWRKKGAAGAEPEFHVTERFERVGGVLQRSVEYNGVLSRQLMGTQHTVELYFWDTLQAQDAATLRLICHYRLWQPPDNKFTSICALQDAVLDSESLDLSADVAILHASDTAQAARLSYPWDPDRRKLYRLLFDTAPAHYVFQGFLRIRSAAADHADIVSIASSDELQIVPAWLLCDRDLIPWFDADSRTAVPNRDSWTSAGLLRSANDTLHKPGLELKLYGIPGYGWEQCYASTLIGTLGPAAGVPLWVPSPVRVPPEHDQFHAADAGSDGRLRLWLFDPGPRMVAQWTLPAIVEDDRRRVMAQQQAMQRLWRMGWTREAVLELPRTGDPDQVEWLVVDSPLLNRGASLAWFGWPLAPDAQYPFEALPATRQVPQMRPSGRQSYSVQVEFEKDFLPGESHVSLVRDRGPKTGIDEPIGLTFRARGMRIGVQHKLVAWGAQAPAPVVAPSPLAWPDPDFSVPMSIKDGRITLRMETVDLAQAGLNALPDSVLQYTFPYPCSELRIADAPHGLQWLDSNGNWAEVGNNERLKLTLDGTESKSISLRLPDRACWSVLSVTLRTQAGQEEVKTLFPSGGTRLAGVFDGNNKLLAFGEEQAFYVAAERPSTLPPEQGVTIWTRMTGVALPPRQAAVAKRVITIDLDGRFADSAPEGE